MVASVLSSLHEMLKVSSPNTKLVNSTARNVHEAIYLESIRATFNTFAENLVIVLQSPLDISQSSTMPKRRELMWIQYARLDESLYRLWEEFLSKIDVGRGCRLFIRLMNDYIFESLIKDVYDLKQQHPQIHTSKLAQLTKDKCNILRYVCGYVMMKIHGKYLKQSSNKAAMFV